MPDIPNNATTTSTITLGGTHSGELETDGDRDWIRIQMTNGDCAQVNLSGVGSFSARRLDPFVRAYDSDGNLVTENDDFNGLDSQATLVHITSKQLAITMPETEPTKFKVRKLNL